MSDDRVAAIIPVAALDGAKTRLGESLDPEERQDLVSGFLERTVQASLAASRVDDVLVVSPDREVLRRVATLGARTLLQRSGGLNAGIRLGRDDAVAGGATAILVVPIDLPHLDAPTLDAVVEASREAGPRTVVLITDRHGTGTNVLALRPPDVIDPAFGVGSRERHRTAAEAAGATYVELDGPLTLDIDTAEDLLLVGDEVVAP